MWDNQSTAQGNEALAGWIEDMNIQAGALVAHPDHKLPVKIVSVEGDHVVMIVSFKSGGCYRAHTTVADFSPKDDF